MDAEKEIQTTLMLLVRHGQTPTTGKILPGRAAGLNLSEHGRDQAARVAQRLAALPVTAIYSSPLERTIQTAGPAAEYLGLPIYKEPGLLEGDFGDWTGAQLADLMKLPEWQTVQQRPDQFRFPNGESFAEMRDRMVTTLRMLRNRHPGGTVVCFSHADPIRIAVSDALGNSLSKFQRISIGPCSVSAIRYQTESVDNDPMVLTVNSTLESLSKLAAS
ncbi:MAG TPA: histidine phosphatase family protein [Candidatus Yaniella excrementigallinarum]|nr:histidine phosphatase family protein [Candidatus Yaniella excrementigallinarum]